MRTPALPLLIATALALTGCNRSNDDAPSITINADGGNVLGAIDGRTGEMKIDMPGFRGAVTLPKIKIDAGNFDLNGVRLYPGSTIETISVVGGARQGDTEKRAATDGLRLVFASPATTDTVRRWFAERLTKVGYVVGTDGAGLVGTTDENQPFRLDLAPDGPDRAKGTIVIGG